MTQRAGLRVQGGAAGTVAVLADLEHAADLLRRIALGLGAVTLRVGAAGANPGWTVTATLSPVSFERAVAAVLRALAGTHGVAPQVLKLELLGDGVAASARLYRAADVGSAAVLEAAREQLGRTFGVPLLTGLVPLVAVAGVRAAHGDGTALYELTSRGAGVEEVADILAGTTTGLLGPAMGPAAELLSEAGARVVPGSGSALAGLIVLAAGAVAGGTGGALHDPLRGVRIHVEQEAAADGALPTPEIAPEIAPGVAGLVARVPEIREPVRIERIDSSAGRAWVVGVPGTSSWGARPGADPFDLTSDVELVAGRRSGVTDGVLAAMRAAGVRPGEPVMLTGHSLGGLIAASIAADPAARREFAITHVLTSGSPIASVPVPDDVQVLSLEHQEDVVPHLDGDPNPDRPNWVTVQRSVDAEELVRRARAETPMIAHDHELYVRTAAQVDASSDPSLVAWRQGAEQFMARPGRTVTAFDATISRVGPG